VGIPVRAALRVPRDAGETSSFPTPPLARQYCQQLRCFQDVCGRTIERHAVVSRAVPVFVLQQTLHFRKLLDPLEEIGFARPSTVDQTRGAIEGLPAPQVLVLIGRKAGETLVRCDL
jgi:hypothetical protein